MRPVWNDANRFNQTGYSAPTVFPDPHHYQNLDLFLEDTTLAVSREKSRREWLLEERMEALAEEAERIAEAKAEREERMLYFYFK